MPSKVKKKTIPTRKKRGRVLPLLALKDIVLFPNMVVPLLVGREKSIKAIETAVFSNGNIFLATQKSAENDNPGKDDIYRIGTEGKILQILKIPDGSAKIMVEGLRRLKISAYEDEASYFSVRLVDFAKPCPAKIEIKAMMRRVRELFENYVSLNPRVPAEIAPSILDEEDPERLVDNVCAHVLVKIPERQELLEIATPDKRLLKLISVLESENEILRVEKKISSRVRRQIDKSQKTYYLHEQLKAIEKELGKEDFISNEIKELEEKILEAKMPPETQEKVLGELEKYSRIPTISPEASVYRNYIDWLVGLPWTKITRDNLNIEHAEKVLDSNHFGLKEPKERIIEYLAVRKLSRKLKGPILCLVGPPGVGKTSLARSIAEALGRKFVKFSLGGVRDEAEIRGHRRTYVGAMPGRIIQSLSRAGTRNPVFLLDEIDKMSVDFRGDPSSALLETLDPEQNIAFNDHYIEVDFDLSQVMFIATANIPHTIHPTLFDRMEIIRIPGYTEWEKLGIAERFLVPKQLKENGLAKRNITFPKNTLLKIIREYTREAGLRNLERGLSKICRKIAREVVKYKKKPVEVRVSDLKKYLGPPRHRHEMAGKEKAVGVSTGMAWTEVGGEILKIETLLMDGKGRLTLTGQLGDVMQESAHAALSYIRSNRKKFKLAENFHKNKDIHVHVPMGHVSKDGPSAGVAIVASMLSALTKKPIPGNIALTGEITLRGNVLPIGGLKEKVLAAHRSGIKTIIIPKENEKDLAEIPANIKRKIKFIAAEKIDEILSVVFLK